jgi:hypothetical protein
MNDSHVIFRNSFTSHLQNRHHASQPHLIMDDESFSKCPGCNSVITGPSDIPGFLECRYCRCVYPARLPRREIDLFSFVP